ncbi:transposase [Nostocales cyanobacterium HT-58-2]|nr:transposase [Nostocales cyanobacterium HT-58-2]ARV59379.1 transposase [Nostocales cyanobacterium HT-58-2]ARV60103.1 transposase [Nostocales cyanobacterium HT-58-2]ARV60295.1 transposase [Nostocales cyanobacterium HT-58-2]ARV61080.1 transposase [Nostocales cyanobacterium HT-58-2]
MLPKFYQNCFSNVLTPTQYKMLSILIMLLQFHKTVTIEKLSSVFPQPILFESRRRSIQRFLLLPQLSIQYLWFPLLKRWIKNRDILGKKQLIFAIDRTQWRDQNVFVISFIEEKRAIPVYWLLLSKRGCSNLGEQKKLIRPLLRLFKGYRMLVLGDREFHSIKLANWLHSKGIDFVLRQKQGTYIRQENQSYQRLQSLGLIPGISFFLTGIQATKQKGFTKFNLAGYYKRKYRGKVEPAGWFLLTNLNSLESARKAFKLRSGIEAMFKDCKTGGYNLESTSADGQRLIALILLIAIAYTCAVNAGRRSRQMGLQKYVGRLKELHRLHRRHSTFWVGLYGLLWVGAMEFWAHFAHDLMRLKPSKLPYFHKGLRAMSLIQSAL